MIHEERWFISYKMVERDFLTSKIKMETHGVCVTDTTPARWTMYRKLGSGYDHYVLYAEQISLALASELVHGGANVSQHYYKEDE